MGLVIQASNACLLQAPYPPSQTDWRPVSVSAIYLNTKHQVQYKMVNDLNVKLIPALLPCQVSFTPLPGHLKSPGPGKPGSLLAALKV